MSFAENPIVSFERDGGKIELGRFPNDDVIHLHGSTGLGLPPVQVGTREKINADGSHLVGIRYGDREVFLPFGVWKPTKRELTEFRRRLYRSLAPHLGPVTIRVSDPPTGSNRTISGYLQKGLEGDFTDDFNGYHQTFGLSFTCLDPWWQGEPQRIESRIRTTSKPFISTKSSFFPVILSGSSVRDEYVLQVVGDGEVYPTWVITGPGSDLTISNGKDTFTINHELRAGEKITIDTQNRRITPDLWSKVPLSSRLFPLTPGENRLTITMVGATPETSVDALYRERYMEAV